MRTRLLLLACFLLVPVAAWAQSGKITGTITDRETGESLPGATVVIEGTQRGTASDINGEYVLLNVDPGVYTLQASFVGYGTQIVQEVTVNSDFTTIVDFQLGAGVELDEVVVQGQRLIQQDEVSTTTVIRGEDIQELPIDNFRDALTLAAGIVESTGGDDPGIHVRGGRSTEIAYIVDGVLVEDPMSGTLGGFDVGRQAIDELQVLTGGFSAKYGNAMSGIIVINTPTGGNEYHGSLRFSTDGYSLEGIGQGGPTIGEERPFANDWGTRTAEVTLSGPILRDRLTFFINADRLDTDTYQNEFDGPVRPAVLPWSQLEGLTFLRTVEGSFVDANGQPVDVDPSAIGLEEGATITQDMINQLQEAGVDVSRLGEAAVSDYQVHHSLGLYNDRTRLTANVGFKISQDMDARASYKLTRREYRTYDHQYKYLPQYNNTYERNIDMFSGQFSHRVSSSVYYEVQASYTNNRYYDYLYEEQKERDNPLRFGRIFSPNSVSGAFDTEGLSDDEGGSNYDFLGYTPQDIYIDYPFLTSGDLGQGLMLSQNIDFNGDGTLDVYRNDRLTEELVERFRSLTDEQIEALGFNRNASGQLLIPILAPPTEYDYEERKIKDFQISFEMGAQLNNRNLISFGVDYRRLELFDYTVFANGYWDGSTPVEGIENPETGEVQLPWRPEDETYVDAKPFEISAFVEDKIEFSNLVVRPGLRLDVLNTDIGTFLGYGSGGVIQRPRNENDPVPQPKDAENKWRISPRLGIAFPITDRARLSFNYGQFLQYPEFNRLYQSYRTAAWIPGSGYVPLDEAGFDLGFESFLGNPDVDPEKTIFYQFDAEFLVTENFKLGTALFYKDIYDYVALSRILGEGGQAFWVLNNLDYANSRGFEIRAEKRLEEYVGFSASYTYSRSIGNADDAEGRFDDWYSNSVNGTIPPKGAQPLDWDQPHTFNFTVNGRYQGFAANLIGRFGSGLPYTLTSSRGRPIGQKNSARRPWTGVLDARLVYTYEVGSGATVRPFIEVTNILDRDNVLNVFTDTGLWNYTLDPGTQYEDAQRIDQIGPPRHFEVGVQLSF